MEAFRNSSNRINLSSKSAPGVPDKFRNKKSASVGDQSPVSLNDCIEPPSFLDDTKEHFEANEVQINLNRKFDDLSMMSALNIESTFQPTEIADNFDTPNKGRLSYIDFSTYKQNKNLSPKIKSKFG
jgi:hypothetical protein